MSFRLNTPSTYDALPPWTGFSRLLWDRYSSSEYWEAPNISGCPPWLGPDFEMHRWPPAWDPEISDFSDTNVAKVCTVNILRVQCLPPILVEQIPRSLFNLFLAARCKNQKPPHCNLLTANNALDRRNSKSQMQLKNHNFLQFPTMHPQYWIYDIALSHLTSALFIFQVSVGALSGWTKRLSFFLAAAKVSWSPDSSRGTTGSFNISASSCNKHQTAATQLLHAYLLP